ncbi:histidine N-acetyltransferase-like [Paramuricea clavata]|uniref:Histidine N-acetyltransferase-like n=1 Tax=Paramuricea clavata TaxID=317549 RepID=A0A6S7JLU0_PARCT|nr:histidine N-acetyltransferase-like [Paramuricea clavata]
MAAMNVSVRLAVKTDLSAVWEMSEDIHAGLDTLPHSFLQMLDDPQHTVLVAVKDGKAVGLRAVLIVDDGETAIFRGLRVHMAYRGRGIAKELMKVSEGYVKQHFPRVQVIRYSVTSQNKSRLALQMKCNDRMILKLALCACVVEPSRKTDSVLQRYSTATSSTRAKELNINNINIFLKQNKLDDVLFNSSFFVNFVSFRAIESNISNGLIDDKHNFFASSTDNTVESLSQSCRIVAVKFPKWCVTLYKMDENLLEIHLIKHLKKAILRDSEEKFAFICVFHVSLVKHVSKFLLHELALKNIDDFCSEGNLFVSVFEKDL